MAFGRGGYRGRGRGRGQGDQGGGRGGGQGGNYHGSQSNGHQSGGNTMEIVVKGWTSSPKPHDQQLSGVLGWLKSRSGCQILQDRVVKHHILFVKIYEKDKNRFFQLNNQNHQGSNITVEETRNNNTAPPSAPRDDRNTNNYNNHHTNNTGFGAQNHSNDSFPLDVEEQIATVIRSRYIENDKHLNLQKLPEDASITAIPQITTETDGAKVWAAIFSVCKSKVWPNNHQRNLSVHLITLSDNKINNVSLIESLPRFFPRVIGLDLSNNGLQNLNDLIDLKDKLRELNHIVLHNNPVCYLPETTQTLRQWFPKLKQINSTPVENIVGAIPPQVPAPGIGIGTGVGTGIGQTPFRPDPQYANVQAYQAVVDINRPYHPEVPKDSYFAVMTPDKAPDVFQREVDGLKFSIATKLNMAATEECLKANHWNYDAAIINFNELHAKGAIPMDKYLRF
ncbi:nuclear mRNA export, poly(A)+RNA binding protein [Cladophialophora chaetospira]|uniref:Nuclear mRNA export, poly(A)+RNA binding protein n=1 Tax=Cladophialophora chaetospira TaxID=386627 RepID=A0AA38XLZ1_9EURO|nr:nuclear mRNA export, poly(A)+RNA binding protein [Cladophialophora chaetospira]